MAEDKTNNISSQIRYGADVMLGAAIDIAEELLECGGEIQRAEDTVERICRAYGAVKVDAYATTSLITVTVTMPDGYHKTQTRRINDSRSNYRRIEELNALSRRICAEVPSPDEFEAMLKQGRKEIRNRYAERYIGGFMMVAAFTLFFGGSWLDALFAAIVGSVMTTILFFAPQTKNSLANTVACSLIGGILSLGVALTGLPVSADKIMIGTIMLLVPGVDIGNSLRDLLSGDTVSGTMRLIKALLTATAIAVGYSIAVIIGSTFIEFSVSPAEPHVALYVAAGLFGTFGYALLNRMKKSRVLTAAVVGAVGVAVWQLCEHFTENTLVSNLAASCTVTLLSEILARVTKAPTTVYLIPGIIPLVPGGRLYYTMSALVASDMDAFRSNAGITLEIALGIAVGIVIVSTLFSYLQSIRQKRARR